VDNVVKVCYSRSGHLPATGHLLQEYERTGYVWEQYDALTGEGRRRFLLYSDASGRTFLPRSLQSPVYRMDVIDSLEWVELLASADIYSAIISSGWKVLITLYSKARNNCSGTFPSQRWTALRFDQSCCCLDVHIGKEYAFTTLTRYL